MLVHLRQTAAIFFSIVLALAGVQLALGPTASAAPNHDKVVSTVPPAWTPAVNNGSVRGIAQVGSTMVAIGPFSSVTPPGSGSVSRDNAFAFNATSGSLVSGFNPSFNGAVNDVIPGPTAGTVYVAGAFTQVNGTNRNRIALLNVNNGSLVTSFTPPNINGAVNSIALSGNRLYVGGNFTAAANNTHRGLLALNATTGARDTFMGNDVTERHNDSGSGAQGAIGVRDLEVTPDGQKLVAIGNFKRVDDLPRDQVVVINTSGSSSEVAPDWRTRRFEPYCFNWAFDTYVRGVSVSPDGSFFVVASTGGHNGGTLCDTAARFEFSATGDQVQPTWVDYSGGDTLWGVEVTETAVYVGGHQRWMNNSLAGDTAGPGAVPRPGLAALDTETGAPLAWNAARNPRGSAVYALEATPAGVWMGSDTTYVGPRYSYLRPRLAFFPHASGTAKASDETADLPGRAYIGAPASSSNGNVLYRVNAGGGSVGSVDAGPDWESDDAGSSPYRNDGSNAAGWSAGATTDATVPSSTPNGVFDSERWSPSDDPAMEWAFNAPAGAPLQVRLFFANRCDCTAGAGQRVFDVSIDGNKVLDNFDIVAAVGDQRGTMRAYNITSDGTVDIDFSHEVENPLINAIEIVRTDLPPPSPGTNSLRAIQLNSGGAESGTEVSPQGVDWTTVRGSFVAGGKLWYGRNDGLFYSRTISSNGTLGQQVLIDPYNDPDWAGVSTGSGNTYDGRRVALYAQMASVTSMAYDNGRLYYTRSGDSNLYWRWFSTDSGIIGSDQFTANGGRSWNGTAGMFFANGSLHFVTSNGNLNRIGMSNNTPSGAVTVVDGPAMTGNNWRGRAVYLTGASAPPPNVAPTASFTSNCVALTCTFNGSGSNDPDGSIDGYAWDFGPGTESGQVATHTFADEGTYTVRLTVTDDRGGTGTTTRQVTVEESPNPTQPISYVASASANGNSSNHSVNIPAGVQPGDLLLLTASISNAPSVTTPPGWTLVKEESTTGLSTYLWRRTATAGDAGASVPVSLNEVRKTALTVTAYRGASGVGATAAATSQGTSSHTAPGMTVPSGSWVVWFFADKSADTTAWTPGALVNKRVDVYNSGAGRTSALVGDTGVPRSGSVPGATATTDVDSNRGVSWSIVLEPTTSTDPGPNVNPTANFTASCSGLACTFNGSGSNDPDGSIASYAWEFNPGTGSGQVAPHTFAGAGTYTVRLTVTDNRGGTGTTTQQVTVDETTEPSQPINFVAASDASGNVPNPSVNVPNGVQAGDTLLLTAAVNNSPSVTTPSGWTLVGEQATTGLSTYVWRRTASAGDAGSSVPVALSDRAKTSLVVSAYRGVSSVGATNTEITQATSTHQTPALTVPSGSWVVWFFADKSPNTADWTPGAGLTLRAESYNSGTGRVSGLVGDSAGPRNGAVAGVTATTDVTSSRGVSWSIALLSGT